MVEPLPVGLGAAEASIWVVVNPVAGGSRAIRAWAALKPQFEARVSNLRVVETVAPRHATEVAGQAVASGAGRVVVVGGDGTIQEVVAALCGSPVVLGVIPAGTGNDFSRTHGLPLDYGSALETALRGAPRRIDLGVVNGRPFINVGGVGFDAEVAGWVKRQKAWLKGPALYLSGVLTQLWAFSPQDLTYTIDGTDAHRERALLVSVGNGKYYGGGMMICPQADSTDGLLDVVVGGNLGKMECLALLPKLFRGLHLGHPKVKTFRGSRVRIDGPAGLTVHADGEPCSGLPAEFSVLPGALLVAMNDRTL